MALRQTNIPPQSTLVGGSSLLARILSDYLPASAISWLSGQNGFAYGSLTAASVRSSLPPHGRSLDVTPSLPPLASPFTLPVITAFSIHSLQDLLTGWLLAVPKSKVTHSRKGMRSANKGLKNKDNISLCPACSAPKLSHHLCTRCYSQISRRWKEEARAESAMGRSGHGHDESYA